MEPIKDVLEGVLLQLKRPEALRRQLLMDRWAAIVGAKLAGHTKPSLAKNGKLYVWVDQSTLAFEINQKYKPSILKRTQAVMGEEAVKEIRVRVGQIR